MSEEKKEYKIPGRPATIFRTVKDKDNPYVMIDRRPIDNPNLSFKAKGILTYLMSRPDGWEVSIADLVKHGQEGEAAIRSGLKELREAGHMLYETSRKDGRITGWLIRVFEVPNTEYARKSPDCDFQEVENLQVENQDVENRTQVLSTISSNQKPNIKHTHINADPVAEKLAAYKYKFNPNSAVIISGWKQDFTDDIILRAIEEAHSRNVHSMPYVDKIIIDWKANGIPPTREEQIAAAKAQKKPHSNYPRKQTLQDVQADLAAWLTSEGA